MARIHVESTHHYAVVKARRNLLLRLRYSSSAVSLAVYHVLYFENIKTQMVTYYNIYYFFVQNYPND